MKKKPIYQQFIDFKRRNNLTNSIIREMITEYANSGPSYAKTYFMEKYQISKHVFYRARDFAVICMLVDGKTQRRIFEKAKFNSSEHNEKRSSYKSSVHTSNLKVEREAFFSSFTAKEIEDICRKYAEGIEVWKIAAAYDTGEFCIKNLLKKGILLNYIDEKTYQAIALRIKLAGGSIDSIFRHK